MSININNYEEYFLLYIDNELSQQERNEVNSFLKLYPELKEEFKALQFTFNSPEEEIILSDKSFLLKNESSAFINENNFEEHFVAYHDNELNDQEKQEVEKFITAHAELKNDFELLGTTKLVANETIVFPNKNLLYKKEKGGKVVPMMMWRALAAAVFTGFGLWFFISYSNQKIEIPPIVIAKNVEKTSTPKAAPVAENSTVLQPQKVITPSASFPEKRTTVQKNTKEKTKIISTNNNHSEGKEKEVLVKNEKEKSEPSLIQQLPQIKNEMQFPEITTKEIAINSPDFKNNNLPDNNAETIKNTNLIKENTASQFAKQASFTINEKEKSDDYIFYNTPSEDFSRTKVGGFLKKMKRMIVRGNPITQLFAGDDKQVASN